MLRCDGALIATDEVKGRLACPIYASTLGNKQNRGPQCATRKNHCSQLRRVLDARRHEASCLLGICTHCRLK
eukprot:7245242-Prymnesium_polylepis.1